MIVMHETCHWRHKTERHTQHEHSLYLKSEVTIEFKLIDTTHSPDTVPLKLPPSTRRLLLMLSLHPYFMLLSS